MNNMIIDVLCSSSLLKKLKQIRSYLVISFTLIIHKIHDIRIRKNGINNVHTHVCICDWICENVHSSHIHFFNFEGL